MLLARDGVEAATYALFEPKPKPKPKPNPNPNPGPTTSTPTPNPKPKPKPRPNQADTYWLFDALMAHVKGWFDPGAQAISNSISPG